MSFIFDALQKSGAEQSGVEYPDVVSVLTEVFEAPQKEPAKSGPAAPDFAALLAQESAGPAPEALVPAATAPLAVFPTLRESVAPTSRLVFATEPDSLAAEKFRFLGVRLRQLQQSRPLKKILITSTIPEEGKSLVSCNLAGVLARRKQKVLLIDGDLRRPVLADEFGLGRLAGLAEWLQSDRRQLTNIYHLEGLDFWFMPAGSPPANPLEMIASKVLGQMMDQISTYFDWIIVDSPPLLPLADTTVWSRVTDGTLLVSRVGKTEKSQLLRGLEIVKKSDLIGVVLNGSMHSDRDYYQRYAPK